MRYILQGAITVTVNYYLIIVKDVFNANIKLVLTGGKFAEIKIPTVRFNFPAALALAEHALAGSAFFTRPYYYCYSYCYCYYYCCFHTCNNKETFVILKELMHHALGKAQACSEQESLSQPWL